MFPPDFIKEINKLVFYGTVVFCGTYTCIKIIDNLHVKVRETSLISNGIQPLKGEIILKIFRFSRLSTVNKSHLPQGCSKFRKSGGRIE